MSDSDENIISTNPLLVDSNGDGTEDGDDDFDGDGIINSNDTDHNTGPPPGFLLTSGTLNNNLLVAYPSEVMYLTFGAARLPTTIRFAWVTDSTSQTMARP